MTKKNKLLMAITSVLTLLPVAAGLLLWQDLPDVMATHFGMNNEPNGWSSKTVAVFVLPLMLLLIHWIAYAVTAHESQKKNFNSKVMKCVFWVVPFASLIGSAVTYASALNINFDITLVVGVFVGIILIFAGNYMPKCKQSYFIGIKTPWTLTDSENWRSTHRLGGYSMFIGGVLTIISAVFHIQWLMFTGMFLAALLPCGYSYVYYRMHK